MDRLWFLVFLGGFVIPGVQHVWGIEIFTTSEVEAVNGTSVTLKCTFSSTQTVSLQTVTVIWDFQSITSKQTERILYYQGEPYPPNTGLFKGRVKWSGDILRKDASITLNDVRPTFNGTYTCQVANPPDVHGNTGETILRVVNKVPLSEISLLAAAVGGSCAVILVFLGIFIAVKMYRRPKKEKDIEMRVEEYSKDPTVW
ncbi:myelin protein zero-like protein 2b [Poeciliopsis prolifica]|uniref:myelin protein zero-like protein 2b n=1 Tax=Poeciliopsis prolifica TaxID=188132 RepID=UPI0024136CA2|nr:myelin protein zero-like protein 2b [Poeciliopsis prolifica]